VFLEFRSRFNYEGHEGHMTTGFTGSTGSTGSGDSPESTNLPAVDSVILGTVPFDGNRQVLLGVCHLFAVLKQNNSDTVSFDRSCAS